MSHASIMRALDESPVFDVHEHFSLPWTVASSRQPLVEVLRRAYIGSFDFHPGLVPPLIQFSPQEDFPGEDPGDVLDFLRNFDLQDFLPSITEGILEVHQLALDNLDEDILEELNTSISDLYLKESVYRDFLDRWNVTACILDVPHFAMGIKRRQRGGPFSDPRFHAVLRVNSLLFAFDADAWTPFTNLFEVAWHELDILDDYPRNLEEYLGAIDAILEKLAGKFVGVKCASAYERTIDFGRKGDASEGSRKWDIATRIFGKSFIECSPSERNAFGDVIIHHVLDKIADLDVPFQVHTGTAIPSGSHPGNLAGTIEDHPDVQFGLLHCGYPWIDETIAFLERFPNTHAEMAWLPMLSRESAKEFAKKVIEHGLESRVIAFGGDCASVEGSVGALSSLKQVLLEAIASSLGDGTIQRDDVEEVIRALMHDNGRRLYPLTRGAGHGAMYESGGA